MTTENQFLSSYDFNAYDRPSVSTDVAAFMVRTEESENYRRTAETKLSILLIQRGVHPFFNAWALPGGFLRGTETVEECALREVEEETNVSPRAILPVAVFSEPSRDPRGRVISHAFASIICEEDVEEKGGYDALAAKWFDISLEKNTHGQHILQLVNGDIRIIAVLKQTCGKFHFTGYDIIETGGIAFDHAKIIATALSFLQERAIDKIDNILDFVPDEFTLSSLLNVYDTITGRTSTPANFRRKIAEYVEETDKYVSGAGHRPAKLYRKKKYI